MFDFLNKKKAIEMAANRNRKDKDPDDAVKLGTGVVATESARVSTQAASQKFAKPVKYDRSLLDDGAAKRNIKIESFKSGVTVKDPYTGDVLTLTKAEARIRYGDDWAKHLAEADHKIPLEQRYEQTKNNPWLTNDDVKASSNSKDNLEVVSRKYNNAKRSRSNEDFVNDEEYLQKTGVKLSKTGKANAVKSEKAAQKALKRQDLRDSARNLVNTGHAAGKAAAQNTGMTAMTLSGIMNVTAVVRGEKTAEEAIVDVAKDTGKAAAMGYATGGGLTVISHTLSSSSSTFLRALSESNVPGKIITAVIVTGDTLKRYGNGEISTQECLLELGEKGLNFSTSGYAMAVGQALIPIPIVGAAVGAIVGSMLTSSCYNALVTELRNKELESKERKRIIAECQMLTEEIRAYQAELEKYLETYFHEYKDCFDDALNMINTAFASGEANGIVLGANKITRKLGGRVNYDNQKEAIRFFEDKNTDVF